ncbi:MAG TPA: ATP-binding protein, partial [Deltaproteobacteria bacterium]|nr:ATP-binding protein [Deltaproteobacteria bacterium]
MVKGGHLMKAFHTIAVPHQDILDGRLTMDIFAADLWEVFQNRGPEEYKDSHEFFKKTYETEGLNSILSLVKRRLQGQGGDPIIQIQTPFGGGKTHSLIAMYHKAKEWHAKPVVIVGTALSAQETLWQLVEKQLTGKTEKFKDLSAPGREAIREILMKEQPVLILMDEVLEYITKAATVRVQASTLAAQTIAFMQELTEVVSTLERVCLVVSLPSSVIEHYDEKAEKFFQQLQKVAGRLEKIYTPVQEHEISQVIRKRLFSSIDEVSATEEIETFVDYAEKEGILPAGTEKSDYRKRFAASYPFLPEVVDILYHRWGSFPSFQRTRGVLRLLSLVIYSLREKSLPYISLGNFDLANQEIRTELLKHIGNEFNGIISNDITGPEAGAKNVDNVLGDAYKGLKFGTKASTTIFLYSHSGGVEKGANLGEIKRNSATCGIPSSIVAEAVELLKSKLFFLQNEAGKYFFTNKPNLNRIVLTKIENISDEHCADIEKTLLKKNLSGQKFKVYIWPKNDTEIADTPHLKLIILKNEDEDLRKRILEYKGNSPRINRNMLFFLCPVAVEKHGFYSLLKRLEAYKAIPKDTTLNLTEKQKKEIDEKIKETNDTVQEYIRRYYRLVYIPTKEGFKEIDLGIPTYGVSGKIDDEVFSELKLQGDILSKVSPVVLREKYLKDKEYVLTHQLFQSSLATPGEIKFLNENVLREAIEEGVLKGLFGLGELIDGKIIFRSFREKTTVSLSEVEIIIQENLFPSEEKELPVDAQTFTEKTGHSRHEETQPEVQLPPVSLPIENEKIRTSIVLKFEIPKGQVSSIMRLINYLHT